MKQETTRGVVGGVVGGMIALALLFVFVKVEDWWATRRAAQPSTRTESPYSNIPYGH